MKLWVLFFVVSLSMEVNMLLNFWSVLLGDNESAYQSGKGEDASLKLDS